MQNPIVYFIRDSEGKNHYHSTREAAQAAKNKGDKIVKRDIKKSYNALKEKFTVTTPLQRNGQSKFYCIGRTNDRNKFLDFAQRKQYPNLIQPNNIFILFFH